MYQVECAVYFFNIFKEKEENHRKNICTKKNILEREKEKSREDSDQKGEIKEDKRKQKKKNEDENNVLHLNIIDTKRWRDHFEKKFYLKESDREG